MKSDREASGSGAVDLSVSGLTVSYGSFRAIHDLSFAAQPGEVLGLLGPNGAGKTTLIRALCGQIKPDAGTIQIAGKPIRPGNVRPETVSLVPQEIGLYPFLTAAENLDVFARLHHLAAAERRSAVRASLDSVDMSAHAHKQVSAMSGGMKRRINFAAAILNRPRVLILDEPTAGVDVPARDLIHKLARRLAATGVVVILVTHELEQAELVCDRVLVLAAGKKRFHAPAEEILADEFGNKRQITIRLRQIADAELEQSLRSYGFEPEGGESVWSGMNDSDNGDVVAQLTAEISRAGNVAQEVVVRRPGLETLLHKIASDAARADTAESGAAA